MKMLPILVTSVVAGVFVSAMVLAAPLSGQDGAASQSLMNRAEAYRLATAD